LKERKNHGNSKDHAEAWRQRALAVAWHCVAERAGRTVPVCTARRMDERPAADGGAAAGQDAAADQEPTDDKSPADASLSACLHSRTALRERHNSFEAGTRRSE